MSDASVNVPALRDRTCRGALRWLKGVALFMFAGTCLAQAWPTAKPIRLVVPLAAGSTADIVSRIVGAGLAARLGQNVVVEKKVGAGGTSRCPTSPARPRVATRSALRRKARWCSTRRCTPSRATTR